MAAVALSALLVWAAVEAVRRDNWVELAWLGGVTAVLGAVILLVRADPDGTRYVRRRRLGRHAELDD